MDDARKLGLTSVSPTSLLDLWFALFPRFMEMTENGTYRQQDASEAWNEIVQTLQRTMAVGPQEKSLVDKYFRGTYDVQLKCSIEGAEPPQQSTEQFYQLSCFITKDVNHLIDGLKLGMIIVVNCVRNTYPRASKTTLVLNNVNFEIQPSSEWRWQSNLRTELVF